MKGIGRIVVVAGVVGVVIALLAYGCSQSERDEAIGRMGKAARAINGEVRPDDKEHETPNIVAEQQRKERIRQNTKWTAKNRAQHPLEYCQAQLEQLQTDSKALETCAHETACAAVSVRRGIANANAMIQSLDDFLKSAKKMYNECKSSGQWPAEINGFRFSEEELRSKIIEANQKLKEVKSKADGRKNRLAALEKKMKAIQVGQKRLVKTRELVQNAISDIEIRKITENDNGIIASLNAISDSMGAFGETFDNMSLESVVQADENAANDEFEKIMAE